MKTRRVGFVAVLALVGVTGWARPSHAIYCGYDSQKNGTGVVVKWQTMPVPYYINVSKLPQAEQAPAEAAIKAAFDKYAAITCSSLKFEYKGLSQSVSWVDKAILVYFDNQSGGSYFYSMEWTDNAKGDANKAFMMLNLTVGWTVGKAVNKIDIQTAVTQMMPGVLGFYVGDDPWTGNLPSSVKYDYVQTELTAEQIAGVQYLYYKADAGCSQPAKPTQCASMPSPDGVKKDKGPIIPPTDGPKPTVDQYKPPLTDGPKPSPDYWIWTEAGPRPPPTTDDGCCRVSHASSGPTAFYALVGVGLVALLILLRRRR